MTSPRDRWYDDAAGPLVRPFAVARGRTTTNTNTTWRDLNMITLIVTVRWDPNLERMGHEYTDLMRLCGQPISVAEVSATLSLPLATTKMLVGDLIDAGYLVFRSPPAQPVGQAHDIPLLQAVIDGVRRL